MKGEKGIDMVKKFTHLLLLINQRTVNFGLIDRYL